VLVATWTGRRHLDRPPPPGPAAATWTGRRHLDRPSPPGPALRTRQAAANWTGCRPPL